MLSLVQYLYSKTPSANTFASALVTQPLYLTRVVAKKLYSGCRRYTTKVAESSEKLPSILTLQRRGVDTEAMRQTSLAIREFTSGSKLYDISRFASIAPAINDIISSFAIKEPSSIQFERSETSLTGSFPSVTNIKAVFTDFDGTSGSTDAFHLAGYNEALTIIGVSQMMTKEEYDKWSFSDDFGVLSYFSAARGLDLKADCINVLVRIKQQATLKKLQNAQVLFPHAVELFRCLSKLHIPLILVSMADRPIVETSLQNAGVLPYFTHLITCEDVTHTKPHPEPYQRALNFLNDRLKTLESQLLNDNHALIRPQDVMVLEDTVGGVTSGHAFGANVVGITHTTPSTRLLSAGASFTCDSLLDMGSLFFRQVISSAQAFSALNTSLDDNDNNASNNKETLQALNNPQAAARDGVDSVRHRSVFAASAV